LTTLQQKDGWWEGILDGYVGFFYSSFVEEIPDDGETPQAKAPVITHAPSLRKKAGGTGFEVPVPKISLGDITDQDFDGWLWKEGNKKVWKKQWFVLKEFCLYFFENNKYDSPALGLILIPGYIIKLYQDPKREHTFSVSRLAFFSPRVAISHLVFLSLKCNHPSARTYFLAGDSKQDSALWIDTLTRASQAKAWDDEKNAPDILKGSRRPARSPVFDPPAASSPTEPVNVAEKEPPVKERKAPEKPALAKEPRPESPTVKEPSKVVTREPPKEAPKETPKEAEAPKEKEEEAKLQPARPSRPPPTPKPTVVVSSEPVPPAAVLSPTAVSSPTIARAQSPTPQAGNNSPTLAPTLLSPRLRSAGSERQMIKGGMGSVRGKNIKVPVPNVVVKDLPNASWMGWLFKQGYSNKSWKKRWFVLEGFCLYYFDTARKDSPALGMVMLPSYEIVEVSTTVSNRSHCFDLVHPSARCYSLSAESEGDKEDWIDKLNAAITSMF